MVEIKKLNAKFFKEVDKVVFENTEGNYGAYELFFNILSNFVKKKRDNPAKIFELFLNPEKDIEKTINLYSTFNNSIIAKFNELTEGKPTYHLVQNLFNLIKNRLPGDANDEYFLKHIIPLTIHPVGSFLKSYDINKETINELVDAVSEQFREENFLADLINIDKELTLIYRKDSKFDIFEIDTSETLELIIEDVINASVGFLEARKNSFDQEEDTIHTEVVTIGEESTYNGINFDGVQKNDPCPCGSGKKYKKCCRKAWEYPLTTLKPQKVLSKPKLKESEVNEYYKLFNHLLVFVQNDYAKLQGKEPLKSIFDLQHDNTYLAKMSLMKDNEIMRIIEHLINNRELIDKFIALNKDKLSKEDLETYNSWKKFIHSNFIVMQTHNDSEIFVWDTKKQKVYLVYGLYDPPASIIPKLPFYFNTILLPFKGRIIYNGLLIGKSIEYGNNILREMVQDYQECIDNNGIIFEL